MKKHLLTAAVSAALLLPLAGCQQTAPSKAEAKPAAAAAPAKSEAQKSYEAALSKAKSALSAAKKVHNEWRDTGKLIKSAEAAAKKGEYYKAKRIAQAAETQSHLAVQQAKEQAGAGNPGYLYQ